MIANVFLGIAQAFLAVVFLCAGGMKLFLAPEALTMPIALPLALVRVIGVAEVLGATGLLLPWYLGIRPVLTPVAAGGLMMIVIGATVAHLLSEGVAAALFPLVLALLCATVAYRRWVTRPSMMTSEEKS
jgi:uncharacterized membrane protein YfcA